jgi:hypothetical protein
MHYESTKRRERPWRSIVAGLAGGLLLVPTPSRAQLLGLGGGGAIVLGGSVALSSATSVAAGTTQAAGTAVF